MAFSMLIWKDLDIRFLFSSATTISIFSANASNLTNSFSAFKLRDFAVFDLADVVCTLSITNVVLLEFGKILWMRRTTMALLKHTLLHFRMKLAPFSEFV